MNARLIGWGLAAARAGVGVTLIVRPSLAQAQTGSERMLVRTLGGRDLALGLGTALAVARDRGGSWLLAGAVSDLADVATSMRSVHDVGRARAALGALLAVPFLGGAACCEVARWRNGR